MLRSKGVLALAVIAVLVWVLGVTLSRLSVRAAVGDYSTVKVRRGNLVASVLTTGVVEPLNRAEVRANVAGTIIDFELIEGDTVKARQVVAYIDTLAQMTRILQLRQNLAAAMDALNATKVRFEHEPAQYEHQLRSAEIRVQRADLRYVHVQKGSDIEAAEQALAEAEFAYEQLKYTQSLTKVTELDVEAALARVAQAEQEQRDAERTVNVAKMRAADASVASARAAAADVEFKVKHQDKQFEIALAQAQAKVDKSRKDLEYLRATREDLLVAEKELWDARLNLETVRMNAKALKTNEDDVRAAQLRVEQISKEIEIAENDSKIIAQIGGTIVNKYQKTGDFVTPGAPIVAIANLDTLLLRCTVDEVDIGRVYLSQKVTVTFDSLPGVTYAGKVSKIALAGRRQGDIALFEVLVELVSPKDVQLAMTGNVSIVYGEKQSVLQLPNEVISVRQGRRVVNVIAEDGSLTYKRVETGLRNESYTEIVSGLAEGEAVVLPRSTQQKPPSIWNLIRFR
jgi:HlyD family secretion protein